jgi:hypothetical protein
MVDALCMLPTLNKHQSQRMDGRHVARIALNKEAQRGERLRRPPRMEVVESALNDCRCRHSNAQALCDDLRA